MTENTATGYGADVSHFFESLLLALNAWAEQMGGIFESRDEAPGPRELDAALHPLVDQFLDR